MMFGYDSGLFDMIGFGYMSSFFIPFAILFLAWSFLWKGLGLWHSAKRGDGLWFVAILVINTFGILEIIYLFLVAKKNFSDILGGRGDKKGTHHETSE